MRILYLANTAIPANTANSVNIMKMCQAFCANGHRVLLITRRLPNTRTDVADPHAFYGVRRQFKLRRIVVTAPDSWPKGVAQIQLAWWVVNFRPDIVYARNQSLGYRLERFKRPVVLEAHRVASDKATELRSLLASGRLVRLVVTCEPLRDAYLHHFGLAPSCLCVAHNGADPPSAALPAPLRGRPDALAVGYVGSLGAGKGVDLIARLAADCAAIDFHIVGGTAVQLEQRRAQYKHLPNLIIYGHRSNDKIGAYLAAFDIVVAPYQLMMTSPGGLEHTTDWLSPIKVFEYMAAGKPIIASDLPTIREVLVHGKSGWLCDPHSQAAWLHALATLGENPEMRRRLGRRAHEAFSSAHTWRQRAARVLDQIV